MFMLDHVDVKVDVDNHESLSYLIGHLVDICTNIVKKHNKKNKDSK